MKRRKNKAITLPAKVNEDGAFGVRGTEKKPTLPEGRHVLDNVKKPGVGAVRDPANPESPMRTPNIKSPKVMAEKKFASPKDLKRKSDETDADYSSRVEAAKDARSKLTKNLLSKSGSKYNDDYTKTEKSTIKDARKTFQDLAGKKDEIKNKLEDSNLTDEQKAKVEAKLATVKEQRQEANSALSENRDMRREEARKQYIKMLKEKGVTLFADPERMQRLKKAKKK